ncbi:MAG: nitrogenase cofactor biosynthesis protein NifB [Planctomycetaceae bacterium]|nr:nitrogenase cofactor biosynthesis protein NifB [Planctomycetaceae bacterium]
MKLTVLGQDDNAEVGKGCSAGSCGSTADQLSRLSPSVRDRVYNHPCYSEQAHHHFARMHVAVAPACNIQCHYCNRKYDCANESRPGVVSELLTPEQAVKKTLTVAAKIPQLSVLGIAGPGDPLANPTRTFPTFRMLSEQAPDIKLCVSTNGLALPDCVEELARHNIEHVTITINCTDPEIGRRIYPWVFWKHKRVRGRDAAAILIERQQQGLEMLVERDILVKVNSVMIPGVNDEHLVEVSKTVKGKGAFLHNVMPLIAEAEHGTFYGLTGQRGPTPAELQSLQDRCAGDMNMMRHCRQCRADAVGLLGEDRGAEFTIEKIEALEIDYPAAMQTRAAVHQAIREQLAATGHTLHAGSSQIPSGTRPVLMAVASRGGGLINEHFGHAREFLIYEASPLGVRFIGHRKTDLYCSGGDTCGEAETTLAKTISALAGCETVLCSKIGFEPWEALEAAGIMPNGEYAMEPIEKAVAAVYLAMYQEGRLTPAGKHVKAG